MNCANKTPIVGGLQTLQINRGTTHQYKGRRKRNGQPILTIAEEAYFTIKRRWDDKTPLVMKDLSQMTFDDEGFYHLTLEPEDTENLPYGKYVWDFTAVDNDDEYRAKPAHGFLIIGNSAGWIVNETE